MFAPLNIQLQNHFLEPAAPVLNIPGAALRVLCDAWRSMCCLPALSLSIAFAVFFFYCLSLSGVLKVIEFLRGMTGGFRLKMLQNVQRKGGSFKCSKYDKNKTKHKSALKM